MFKNLFSFFRRITSGRREGGEISPDEIFLDSVNLPRFDEGQMEGRIEKAISVKAFVIASVIFFLIFCAIGVRAWILQIKKGEAYAVLSERNALRQDVIFAPRGIVYDRNSELLVYNSVSDEHPDFPSRKYAKSEGLAHLLGYVKYPARDASGVFYSTDYVGKEGVEFFYNSFLTGINGIKITETNALGLVESESTIKPPYYGGALTLSIDSKVQSKLFEFMKNLAREVGFQGGGGIIMDVSNGEILAITSFPEFDPEVLSEGTDSEKIAEYVNNKSKPFLNRVIDGLYTPGSIVKPFLAVAALEEGIISPEKNIYSAGFISVPNPYDEDHPSIFKDWKAHGYVDMRDAIAVSSDVYFYEVGGGFEDQKGLGIGRIEKYMRVFGFGESSGDSFLSGPSGTIPNPEWKAATFGGEAWRVGDTYNTSIGQYGFQVTPVQAVKAFAAIANGGMLLEPTVVLGERRPAVKLNFNPDNLQVVKEGMRQGVVSGTAANLNLPFIKVAAKTGTAELGSRKEFVNSWVTGFFPYDNPRYAFAVVMEKGPHENTIGALYVIRQLLEWMNENTPEYLR